MKILQQSFQIVINQINTKGGKNMFDGQKIREIIKERKYQAYELDDEWDYGIEKCREKNG